MANIVIIPATSAVSWTVKASTYHQEVFRILRNTSTSLPWELKAEHLTRLSWRMMTSGYDRNFRRKVIEEGIRGFEKVIEEAKRKGKDIWRSKAEILEAKLTREGLKNSQWYNKSTSINKEDTRFSSVLFVPATKDSILAKKIKSAEAQNNQGRTSRIKVVERTGSTIEAKLSRKAPWPTVRCEEKEECFYCMTSKEAKSSCMLGGRNICRSSKEDILLTVWSYIIEHSILS